MNQTLKPGPNAIMQTIEKVLEVYSDRGSRGLPIERVYRQLLRPELFQHAYAKLARNEGAMTKGVDGGNVDGMSVGRIDAIIGELRANRWRWRPARRVNIPKKSGGTRPLGIPEWDDKLVQEVLRTLLQAYYEPAFSRHSHGFRPGRGCHTALTEVQRTWKGTAWFIEADIKGCFDNIDHSVLLDILRNGSTTVGSSRWSAAC